MKVKVESEKVGLKLNIFQKTKIMASGPTTSWEIDGETVETVSDFIFGYLNPFLLSPYSELCSCNLFSSSPSLQPFPYKCVILASLQAHA